MTISPIVTVYILDPNTGRILDIAVCTQIDAAIIASRSTCEVRLAALTYDLDGVTHKIASNTHKFDLATHLPVALTADEIASARDLLTGVWTPPAAVAPPTLGDLKAAKVVDIRTAFASHLAAGFSYGGQMIQADDGARANLTACALTAQLAISGAVAWPQDYARGWVAISGDRVPLPTPQDGVSIAVTGGLFYSGLVQHEQDLIDAATAATDATAVAAVDPATGWFS